MRFEKMRKESSTTWYPYRKQPARSGNSMKNPLRKNKPVSAESIAQMADNGKDVSRFFTNSGEMRKPIQRVNVDFTASMLEELENAAKDLNVSRQAVIKTLIRQGLGPAPERASFSREGETLLNFKLSGPASYCQLAGSSQRQICDI